MAHAGGRPRKKIDLEQLEKLAERQWSTRQLAAFFRISVDTLDRRFADLISGARARGAAKLQDALYARALGGRIKGEDGSIRYLHHSDRLLIHALDRFVGPVEQKTKLDLGGAQFATIDKVSGGQVVGETIVTKLEPK